MKDYEQFKPLVVNRAYGSYIELSNGKKIIDAISSWWCKSLGHNHPTLKHALVEQLERFEHVIFVHLDIPHSSGIVYACCVRANHRSGFELDARRRRETTQRFVVALV